MSEQTSAARDAAISAHIADEHDGDLTGAWVLVTETTNMDEYDDDRTSFTIHTRGRQSMLMTTGLLYSAMNYSSIDDD